jgi:hypothetical protein
LWPLTSLAADECQPSSAHPAVHCAVGEWLARSQWSHDIINLRPINHMALLVQHRKKETKFPGDVLGLIKVLSDAGSFPDEVMKLFIWPNISSFIITLGSTQPITEMSTRNLPGGNGRPARKAINLITCLENVEASMFHKLMGLHDLLQG